MRWRLPGRASTRRGGQTTRRNATDALASFSEATKEALRVLQQEMAELVSLLPPHYVISTVLQDRLVHLQLFKRLRSSLHARVVHLADLGQSFDRTFPD